jgi:hypothetical protein
MTTPAVYHVDCPVCARQLSGYGQPSLIGGNEGQVDATLAPGVLVQASATPVASSVPCRETPTPPGQGVAWVNRAGGGPPRIASLQIWGYGEFS